MVCCTDRKRTSAEKRLFPTANYSTNNSRALQLTATFPEALQPTYTGILTIGSIIFTRPPRCMPPLSLHCKRSEECGQKEQIPQRFVEAPENVGKQPGHTLALSPTTTPRPHECECEDRSAARSASN
jgi:hypothetical protein